MAEQNVTVRIIRDFWDKDGTRHRKGKILEVPVEHAFAGVESGMLERWNDAKAAEAAEAEDAKKAKRSRG